MIDRTSGKDERSDEALLADFARTSSPEHLEPLVRRHWAATFRVAARALGCRHAADDAAQEAFVALVRNAERFRAGEPFAPWFRTITIHAIRRAMRTARRRRRHEDEARARRAAVSDAAPAGEIATRTLEVRERLDRLPADERLPIVLHYLEGLTHHEVAASLGCPAGTVSTRIRRGLERLRASAVAGAVAPGAPGAPELGTWLATALAEAPPAAPAPAAASIAAEAAARPLASVAPGAATWATAALLGVFALGSVALLDGVLLPRPEPEGGPSEAADDAGDEAIGPRELARALPVAVTDRPASSPAAALRASAPAAVPPASPANGSEPDRDATAAGAPAPIDEAEPEVAIGRVETVHGRVVHALTRDPLGGVTVESFGELYDDDDEDEGVPTRRPRPRAWTAVADGAAVTDHEGAFAIPVAPGRCYRLEVRAPGFPLRRLETGWIDAETLVGPIEIALEPAGNLRVEVVDDRGEPLTDASVQLAGYDGGHRHATPDALGIASFQVTDGTYSIWAIAPDGRSVKRRVAVPAADRTPEANPWGEGVPAERVRTVREIPPSERPTAVTADGATLVRLVLARTGRLVGRVLAPIPLDSVTVWRSHPSNGSGSGSTVDVDAAGRFELAVASGSWLVEVHAPGIGTSPLVPLTVRPTETTEARFELDAGAVHLDVEVRDVDGHPIENASVRLGFTPAIPGLPATVGASPGGRVALALHEVPDVLTIDAPGFLERVVRPEVDETGGRIEVVLARSGSLLVTVRGADGRDLDDIPIRLVRGGSSVGARTPVSLEDLEPGAWRITVPQRAVLRAPVPGFPFADRTVRVEPGERVEVVIDLGLGRPAPPPPARARTGPPRLY